MTGLWVKPPINQSESGLSIRVDIIICAMVQTLVDGIKFSGMGPVLLTTGLGNLEALHLCSEHRGRICHGRIGEQLIPQTPNIQNVSDGVNNPNGGPMTYKSLCSLAIYIYINTYIYIYIYI